MTQTTDPHTYELIDEVITNVWTMPVRTMEALLELGDEAVAPLLEALEEALESWEDEDEPLNPLWPVVLLGELGDARAVPAVADALRADATGGLQLSSAAAEALAKIGLPALPAVVDLARDPDPMLRIWGYAILGWIPSDEAYRKLADALSREEELLDVIATALQEKERPEAVPLLLEALERAKPWQRLEVEEAIRALHRGVPPDPMHLEDWRLRYRVTPALNAFLPPWPGVAVVGRESGVEAEREPRPLRSLDEILAEPGDEEKTEVCDCCGAPVYQATGLPVCPETAVGAALIQHDFLGRLRDDLDIDDLFEVMDEVEDELLELHHGRPSPLTRRSRKKRGDRIDRLELIRATCRWLIEEGVEDLGGGRATLLAEALRLSHEHGDPEGLLSRPGGPTGFGAGPAAAVAREPEVGRNDPCSCGSGRKYKKCCGHPSAAGPGGGARRGGSGPLPGNGGAPLELRTFDGEPVSFARAHYRMTDPGAVLEALARSPDIEGEPESGTLTWFREGDDEERRLLGAFRLEGDRITLECMSDERLARGRVLLEELAGPHVVHRADTHQNPWQAVREAKGWGVLRDDGSRDKDGIPPEVEAELVQRHKEGHYRTWPDDVLPALGEKTPRELVKSARGRREVAELLRSMEEMEARVPPAHRYDFGKLWAELGIEELR